MCFQIYLKWPQYPMTSASSPERDTKSYKDRTLKNGTKWNVILKKCKQE